MCLSHGEEVVNVLKSLQRLKDCRTEDIESKNVTLNFYYTARLELTCTLRPSINVKNITALRSFNNLLLCMLVDSLVRRSPPTPDHARGTVRHETIQRYHY